MSWEQTIWVVGLVLAGLAVCVYIWGTLVFYGPLWVARWRVRIAERRIALAEERGYSPLVVELAQMDWQRAILELNRQEERCRMS